MKIKAYTKNLKKGIYLQGFQLCTVSKRSLVTRNLRVANEVSLVPFKVHSRKVPSYELVIILKQ